MKKEISKFYRLKKQWLKIVFTYNKKENAWYQVMIVGNTKRKCNDCLRRQGKSPKVFYGKHTGNNLGIAPFKVALNELLDFENTVKNTELRVFGVNKELENIYRYLKRYGYVECKCFKNNRDTILFSKKV